MDGLKEELSIQLKIVNELGLHARPAAKIAEIAQNAKSSVWIINEGERVDAASVIDILTLACVKGTDITLQIEDSSDTDILKTIAKMVEDGFGEQ